MGGKSGELKIGSLRSRGGNKRIFKLEVFYQRKSQIPMAGSNKAATVPVNKGDSPQAGKGKNLPLFAARRAISTAGPSTQITRIKDEKTTSRLYWR